MSLWPLLLLAPAAYVTLSGRRSAWLWLSTGLGLVVVWGALLYVSWHWANGRDGGLLARLFQTETVDRAFHDTYYIIAFVHSLLTAMVPCLLVGLLLLIPGHPHRSTRDTALFWAAALLWGGVVMGPALVMGQGLSGMPRRYVDYPEWIGTLVGFVNLASLAALLVTLFAALRPLWLWMRRRRAA